MNLRVKEIVIIQGVLLDVRCFLRALCAIKDASSRLLANAVRHYTERQTSTNIRQACASKSRLTSQHPTKSYK